MLTTALWKSILTGVFLLPLASSLLPSTAQANRIIRPEQVDCQRVPYGDLVDTAQGLMLVGQYCQQLYQQRQQLALLRSQQPWGTPYLQDGIVCRDRTGDTVCFTPHTASNLRWQIPSR